MNSWQGHRSSHRSCVVRKVRFSISVSGIWVAYKVIPVAYHWDLIPGVASPDPWRSYGKFLESSDCHGGL